MTLADRRNLDLRSRLVELSAARILSGAHVLSFQPANQTNEDRYFVEDWVLLTGRWKMLAVFDGHGAGTEAVDFVLDTLPATIQSALSVLRNQDISDMRIEELLTKCIRDVDMRIQNDLVSLLPGNISQLSDEDIRQAIRDPDSVEGNSRMEVLRARTGTTALVALVDPKGSIHVASLGDCDAIVGTNDEGGWKTTVLSARHNCGNENEVARIRAEHRGEAKCVNTETERTLGLIAVTRAMGDVLFKLSAVYAERVAPLSFPPMHPNYDLKGLAARNLTPPYLSNIAEVVHLAPPQSDTFGSRLLVLASDGLINILTRTKNVRRLSEAGSLWCSAAVRGGADHMAVNILWDVLQGADGHNSFRSMVDGQYGRRVDDITIVVCPL
ncbi:phosphatase 2C-like domain-containing protein [Mycena maculata]|uniref:Phosphatase 2C-like domain-containing protein n=1 Tax=Mycena maculata TaxID=230809 RepID=A0AAD7I5N8_9AGAR|nr:phosphatase 2C-like domain-containing protein [Mycena maculata]